MLSGLEPPMLAWGLWTAWGLSLALAGPSEAETFLRHGDYAAALTSAARAAAASPGNLDTRELYYDLLVSTGQGARALREATAAAAAAPTDPNAQYLLGRVQPDAASSQRAYEVALRYDPDHARAHMGMGAIHEARGAFAEAEAAYARAVRRDPSLSEAWLGRTRALIRLSRSADALANAEAGLAAVPDEPGLALVVAQLAPTRATAVLTAAIARVPDEPRLHEALAALRLDAGDAAGALTEASAALAIDPTSVGAGRTALFAAEITAGRLDAAGRTALDAARNRQ
ncbi:MAG: tetratricopeptide repeat protein, partial [Myxococcota bacterium]